MKLSTILPWSCVLEFKTQILLVNVISQITIRIHFSTNFSNISKDGR